MESNHAKEEAAAIFAKKNPFADFSNFEQKIDEMKPITPDATNKKLYD
jgi:hypothetical protein